METESPASKASCAITCSICGLDEGLVAFSKRQRAKARKHESAKCSECTKYIDLKNSSPDLTQTIPKKKRKLVHSRLSADVDDTDASAVEEEFKSPGERESESEQESEQNVDVSLDAIKREVLGRDQLHIETPGKVDPEGDDLTHITELLHAHGAVGAVQAIAARLQPDLECAICRDILYPPVSLSCGHSFCQDCLDWWWITCTTTSPTCPTCRGSGQDLRNSSAPKVNLALKKCIMALYAPLVAKKIKARKKCSAGENSGQHNRGCEVLSPLEDEFWHSVTTSTSQQVKVRRNITLDEDDQRMQVAMALYQPPVQLTNGIIVLLCLLTMEEDEASDSGFPVLMTNIEDEHFICTNEDKFRQSLLQVEMTKEGGVIAPVARVHLRVATPGIVEFQFDASTCTDHHEAKVLRFKHEDTGAVLEMDLTLLKKGAGGGSFVPLQQRQIMSSHGSACQNNSMLMEDVSDDEEGEDLENSDDEGFIVKDEDSEMEGDFSEDDEGNDHCCICRDGGELMVCDGGLEMDGCGKYFHIQCVDRLCIPEGDWICSTCAKSGGIQIEGNKGHEFVVSAVSNNGVEKGRSGRTLDGDSSAEEEEGNKKSSLSKKLQMSSANDRPFENKRRIVLEDSDDE